MTLQYQGRMLSVKSGFYTGDGALTQAISGLGFRPVFLMIMVRQTTDGLGTGVFLTWPDVQDDITGGAMIAILATTVLVQSNTVASLDADGFTVDDNNNDENPNTNATLYNYFALGY